jgi:hypothetical protein
VDGSLRGADLDGGWGNWNGQQLLPSRDLRRRFDQLLTTVGEAEPDELRAQLVAWLAERDLGPQGAQEVLAVWDRYLKLQQHTFQRTHGPDPRPTAGARCCRSTSWPGATRAWARPGPTRSTATKKTRSASASTRAADRSHPTARVDRCAAGWRMARPRRRARAC